MKRIRLAAILPFLVLVLAFAFWEAGVRISGVSKDTLPPPTKCFLALTDSRLYQVSDGYFNDHAAVMASLHFGKTLARVALALIAVALLAIPCAVLLARSAYFRVGFTPLFSSLASVSPIVWTLVAIRMPFLDDEYMKPAFVIMAASIFLTSISIGQQFDSVPESLRNLGQRLGARKLKFWLAVILPSSAPQLLHLFRVQFLFGLAIVPFVELSGSQYGVGTLVYYAKQGSNISLALGLILLLAAIGYAVDFVFRALHAKLFKWRMLT